MKSFSIIVLWLFAIFNGIATVFILCNGFPRQSQFDYIGVIVGILALLVTLLIGWNIYSIININHLENKLKRNIYEFGSQSHNALTEFILDFSNNSSNNKYIILKNMIASIKYNSEAENYAGCNSLIQRILDDKCYFGDTYSTEQIAVLKRFMLSVNNTTLIDRWKEFRDFILDLKEYEEANI